MNSSILPSGIKEITLPGQAGVFYMDTSDKRVYVDYDPEAGTGMLVFFQDNRGQWRQVISLGINNPAIVKALDNACK